MRNGSDPSSKGGVLTWASGKGRKRLRNAVTIFPPNESAIIPYGSGFFST